MWQKRELYFYVTSVIDFTLSCLSTCHFTSSPFLTQLRFKQWGWNKQIYISSIKVNKVTCIPQNQNRIEQFLPIVKTPILKDCTPLPQPHHGFTCKTAATTTGITSIRNCTKIGSDLDLNNARSPFPWKLGSKHYSLPSWLRGKYLSEKTCLGRGN